MAKKNQKLILAVSLLLFVLTITLYGSGFKYLAPESFRHKTANSKQIEIGIKTERENIDCEKELNLSSFPETNPDKNHQIFFIENSIPNNFRGRHFCAIESALRNGNLPVKVILRSGTLHINQNPALCSLMREFHPHQLNFYTINLEALFENTPIQGIMARFQ